jgi:hypothetical protein
MSDVKYPGGTLGGVPLFNDENREFVTATNAWRDVPIPRKMRALGKDRRGYPIPFNVLRNEEGRPHFTVNDSIRQHRALVEKRCAICGAGWASLSGSLAVPSRRFMKTELTWTPRFITSA